MADNCGSDGIYAMIALDESASPAYANYSAASPCFPLLQEGSSLVQIIDHVNTAGLNGETEEDVEQTRQGFQRVEGDISLAATPNTIQRFMPYITGMAWATNKTFPVKPLYPFWHAIVHKDAQIYEYQSLQATKFVLSSASGEMMKFVVSVLGKKRGSLQTTWPSNLQPDQLSPYMHADLEFKVNNTTVYTTRNFTLTHDKNMGPRYFDKNEPCGFKRNGKATTSLSISVPHTAANVSALLNAAAPPAYLSVKITLTHPNGTMSTIFEMPGWQIPPKDPGVSAGEILLQLDGFCRRTPDGAGGRTASFIVTNDNV